MPMSAFKLFTRLDGKLVELDCVSICFRSADDAEAFSKFALVCSDGMRSQGDTFSHEHFAGGCVPDLTIEKLTDTKDVFVST